MSLLNPATLLASFGVLGVFLTLFAETGLLVGFFLPGDSLLFTAGVLCATQLHGVHLSLPAVLAAAAAGAIIGAQVGYVLGRTGGHALLARSRSRRVAAAVQRSTFWLRRYGYGRAIVLARFVPVVRTVANPVAGAIGVPGRVFLLWQVVGGLLWSVLVTMAGYGLSTSVPNVDSYLLPIVGGIVVISLIPVGLEILRARRTPSTSTAAGSKGPGSKGSGSTAPQPGVPDANGDTV